MKQKTVEEELDERNYDGEHNLNDAHIVDLPKTDIPEDLKEYFVNGMITKITSSYTKS